MSEKEKRENNPQMESEEGKKREEKNKENQNPQKETTEKSEEMNSQISAQETEVSLSNVDEKILKTAALKRFVGMTSDEEVIAWDKASLPQKILSQVTSAFMPV